MKTTVEEVKQYYEEWTGRYIESFGDTFQSRRIDDKDEFARYLIQTAGLKQGMHIVDAGSGICGPAISLAQNLNVNIDCITISEAQNEIAEKKIQEAGLADRIKTICGDFHDMGSLLPRNDYDAVLFMESFVHSDKPEDAINSALSVIRPWGFLYLKDLFRGTAANAKELQAIETVVENANKYCAMNVMRLYQVVKILEEKPVLVNYIKELGFDFDVNYANKFIEVNRIPLNENTDIDVFDLKFLDYYEIRVTKLA